MRLGIPELLIILVIVLIIFGAGKLPQIGGALGKSIREFRKSQTGEDEEKQATIDKAEKAGKEEQGKVTKARPKAKAKTKAES